MAVIEHEPLTVPQVEKPVSPREILHRAADLLTEFGWCQGTSARDANGLSCPDNIRGGVEFCLLGAMWRAHVDFGGDRDWNADAKLLGIVDWLELAAWNDERGRTKAEVVARLRHAAETAA